MQLIDTHFLTFILTCSYSKQQTLLTHWRDCHSICAATATPRTSSIDGRQQL